MSNELKALTDFWSAQTAAMLDAQQSVARSMTEGMQAMLGGAPSAGTQALGASPELVQAGEAMMQLWSAAAGLSTELANRLSQGVGGTGAARDVLERVTNPRHWMAGNAELDDVLARMVDGPRLADMFDVERRYGSVMRRWSELRQRAVEHQQVLLDAWIRASQKFMTELAGKASTGGEPLEPKQALSLWTDVANRQMLEIQRSEPFLRTQREMIRASTELRLAQAELSEHIGKQYGFPTRTELDDVHKSVTEMRRELRHARRELEALKQAKSAPQAPAVGTLPAKGRSSGTQTVSTMRKTR